MEQSKITPDSYFSYIVIEWLPFGRFTANILLKGVYFCQIENTNLNVLDSILKIANEAYKLGIIEGKEICLGIINDFGRQ